MQIQLSEQGLGNEIALSGRMTYAQKQLFNEIIEHIKNSEHKDFCLDMKNLKFMDSAGLGMLLKLKSLKDARGTSITLRGASGQVSSLLRVAKMNEFFSIETH